LFGLITAASLLFALANAAGWLGNRSSTVPNDFAAVKTLTVGEKLAKLKDAGPADLRNAAWTNPTDDVASTNASGEVVWSDQRQEGFMVISGLEVNDPKVSQYQLWIFDSARNEKFPVDGGVFDVAETGEVIIPIDAKLAISEASAFAVTIEIPGGVVRSERERLPLLAKVAL
jgi:anti-sigma-K factor RskA